MSNRSKCISNLFGRIATIFGMLNLKYLLKTNIMKFLVMKNLDSRKNKLFIYYKKIII